MARAHRPLTSRPNTRLQPFRFPTIKHQLRQTCLTEESIHELLGSRLATTAWLAFENTEPDEGRGQRAQHKQVDPEVLRHQEGGRS